MGTMVLFSYISVKQKEEETVFPSTSTPFHVANTWQNSLLCVIDVLHKHQMSWLKETNIDDGDGWDGD